MKKILFGLVMFVSLGLSAQQIPFYSQYFFNPFVYNPAYSGHSDEVRTFLMHRNQWTGIQGAPVTTMFTIDAPIQGDKAGLGLNVYSDRTDILTTTGARAAYSYGFNISEEHLLKFGLGVGILNHRIDYANAIVEDQSDPNLFSTAQNKSAVDADFGIAYFWRGLQVGVAIPQLLGSDLTYNKVNNDETVVYSLSRHYIFTAGYDFEIDEKFNVYPVLLTRYTPNTPFQFDFGVMGSYQKLFWLGFTYKHEYAVGASVGGIINEKLHVGVSYDFIVNDIAGYAGSSSELLIGYVFGGSNEDKLLEAKRREALRAELDSLENKLKETAEQTDINTEAIDSLGGEIQNVRTDVDEAIEELKKNPPAVQPAAATGTVVPVIPVGENGDDQFSKEYLDNKGEKLPTGFYIVVGSYSEQKWARQAKLRFINAGFPETDVLYNITNKFYNVYLSSTTNEEEARKNLKNARAEYPDAWLRKIQ